MKRKIAEVTDNLRADLLEIRMSDIYRRIRRNQAIDFITLKLNPKS